MAGYLETRYGYSQMHPTRVVVERTAQISHHTNLRPQVIPLLEELRQGGLLGNIEALTAIAADAAADIQRLQVEVLTDDNVRALRDAVQTLTRTLTHIERVVDDFGGLTGDRRVISNLKQFIEALSRLVAD